MLFVFSSKIFLIVIAMSILSVSSLDKIIEDKSDTCFDGFTQDLYMTYRAGRTDASIVLIANNNALNCTLNFNVKFRKFIILVIEFPDWRPGWFVCGNEINKVNVMVRDSDAVEVCSHLRKESRNIYRIIVPNRIQVQVLSIGGLNTLKITATAARDITSKPCKSTEIECKKSEKTYCMSKILECDSHYNCGVKDKFDEDKFICHGYQQLSWSSIMVMVMTAGITILLILATIWNLLPKKKESFIYHGKEIFMEGFDSNSAKHFVVDIEMRYLDHSVAGRSNYLKTDFTVEHSNNAILKRKSGKTSHNVDISV